MSGIGIAVRGLGLLGKKVAKTIKSVKPQVKPTGTKSLIDKYKDTVKNVKSTPEIIEKKSKAVKEIHKHSKKWGGSKADEAAGASLKRKGLRGGGRTNLLEELGRVEAEHSNRNRKAEISRVHSELNKGYKKGGKA